MVALLTRDEDGAPTDGKVVRPTSSKSDILSNNRNTSEKSSLKPRPCTAKANFSRSAYQEIPPAASNTSLNLDISLPLFEVEDNETVRSNELESQHKHSGEKKKNSSMKVLPKKSSSKLSVKERPFSAVEAYKTFVGHSSGVTSHYHQPATTTYMSDFQRARTEAWKSAPKNVISEKTVPPPPQRPTSPASQKQNNSNIKVHVTRANDWLAGGRNLHKEMIKSRPKSGHVPGWKEGLPASFTRPKSGQMLKTRPETAGINPQMLPIYNSVIYGSTKEVAEFPILCNYTSLPKHMVAARHLGVFPAHLKDTEYYERQLDVVNQ